MKRLIGFGAALTGLVLATGLIAGGSSGVAGVAATTPTASPTPQTGTAAVPAPRASGPAPVVDPKFISHPLEAQQYFDNLRRPAPGQPPVPRAEAVKAAQAQAHASQPVGFSQPAWSQVGGNSTLSGQIPGAGKVTGRIYSIVADPADTTGGTLYIASAMGGVWKTTNANNPLGSGGPTWTPLTDSQPSLATTSIVLDPTNSAKIYVGTGDQTTDGSNSGSASYFGAGILFSANGGTSWSVLGASTFTGHAINDLAIDATGMKLYVSALDGLYIGTSSSAGNWTFLKQHAGTFENARVSPGDADLLQIGGYGGPFTYRISTGVLSAPLFLGAAPTNMLRTTIAIDTTAGDTTRVFATIGCDTGSNSCPLATDNSGQAAWWGVWESDDSGSTYTRVVAPNALPNTSTYETSQTFYDIPINVDPLNDNIIYFGLINAWTYTRNTGVVNIISSPGLTGANASCNQGGSSNFLVAGGIHCDQHNMSFDPTGALLSGNDGGIFRSAAGSHGAAWTDLNTNLFIQQFAGGLAYNTANPTRLLGGTQDNGTETFDGTNWRLTDFGDGAYAAIDQSDPTNTWYDSYVFLKISKTTNGSVAWSSSTGPSWNVMTNGFIPDASGNVRGALFVAPFTIDPANHLNLLAGADVPYLTTNGATLWSDISNGATFVSAGQSISATTICPDPTNGGIFYVGTTGGRIFTTVNGFNAAPIWTEVSTGLPGQWITRIACPTTLGTVYATIGGSATGAGTHVFSKTAVGTTWSSIQGNLLNTTVNALAVDTTTTPAALYAATDVGVFQSLDSGTTWNVFGTGLPNVAVTDLIIDTTRRTAYAGTHGRAIWQTSLPSGALTDTLTFTTQPGKGNFGKPLPVQPVVTAMNGVSTDTSFNGLVTLTIKAGTGPAGATLTNFTATASSGVATFSGLTVSAAGLTYVLTASAAGAASVDSAVLKVLTPPDADGNGTVQPLDAQCILRQVASISPTGSNCPASLPDGDVNADGVTSPLDAQCVLRWLAHLPATVPGCPFTP
ncbi:MAG: hypothetical protein ACYDCQ_01920 [Dehalococcoidia bacterium]